MIHSSNDFKGSVHTKIREEHRRYITVNLYRGIAIILMIFFHFLSYISQDIQDSTVESESPNFFLGIMLIITRSAGFFIFLSGFVHSLLILNALKSSEKKSIQIVIEYFFQMIFLIMVNWLAEALIATPSQGGGPYNLGEGPMHYSLLSGIVSTKKIVSPSLYKIFFGIGILTSLGISQFFLACTLILVYKTVNSKVWSQSATILLLILANLFFLGVIFGKKYREYWVSSLIQEKYFSAFLLGFWVGDMDPLFPFAGFIFLGGFFAFLLKSDDSKTQFIRWGYIIGLIYLIGGGILLGFFGFPSLAFLGRAPPVQFVLIQAGGMSILLMFGLQKEFSKSNNDTRTSKLNLISPRNWIVRFSDCSLTIFIFESVISYLIITLIICPIFPNWNQSAIIVFICAVFYVIAWGLFLKMWEKLEYRGSLKNLARSIRFEKKLKK